MEQLINESLKAKGWSPARLFAELRDGGTGKE